jgi:uncharacterized Zn finger protein (UPF0148 family)
MTMTRPGLTCSKCGMPFALRLVGSPTEAEIEALPDPFDATCPVCGHTDQYQQSAMHDLAADPLQ